MATDPPQSDEGLMEAFQRRLDEDAFRQIFYRFAGPARVVAEDILGDGAAAEDVVQEAFLRAVRSRDAYDASRPFAPWFYAILRNLCRDELRRRRRAPEVASGGATLPARAPARAEGSGPVRRLGMKELLGKLPSGQQAVLKLRVIHGLAFRRIGEALGISEEAAKKRAQRGLRRLRRLFFGPDGASTRMDRHAVSARNPRSGD